MKIILFLAVFGIASCGSSHSDPDGQAVGEALSLYNSGNEALAANRLKDASEGDDRWIAESTLSDMQIIRGYRSSDKKLIDEGLKYRASLERAGKLSQEPTSIAHQKYFLALADEGKGNSEAARLLITSTCEVQKSCPLIDSLLENALAQGNRYDVDVVNSISSVLVKHGIRDDKVLSAYLSSQVLINYPQASQLAKNFRSNGMLQKETLESYCRAISLIQDKTTVVREDAEDCSSK